MPKYLKIILFSIFLALAFFSFTFADDSVTITTYYPSPYGVYNELRLYPDDTPNSCGASNKGAIYYNDSQSQMKVCDGSAWSNIGSGGSAGESVMYLRRQQIGGEPANCPSGWTQADYQIEWGGDCLNYVRTCYRTDASCQVMYLRRYPNGAPANCPSGWTQADYQGEWSHCGSRNEVRTCYRCN